LSLYEPFGNLFALISDSLVVTKNASDVIYSYNSKKYINISKNFINLSFSIANLVITFFENRFGLLLSTVHDIGLNSYKCYKLSFDKKSTNLELIKQVVTAATSSLYLVAMFFGCLEVQVASLAVLIASELISSIVEYKKEDHIQLASHLIMSIARSLQLAPKIQHLRAKWAFEKEMNAFLSHMNRIYVGDLNRKWQFPSDHLPVGSNVDGINMISWNVLNNEYIGWVYNNSQGLKDSMITDLDVKIDGKDGLTKRDRMVIDMIKFMTNKKNGIISLQECGLEFLNELEKFLPKDWSLIRSTNDNIKDQNVILYNKKILNYNSKESTISYDGYPSQLGRSIMNCLFERIGGKNIRIFNSHLPGSPSLPGRFDFCNYFKKNLKKDEVSVGMGDMNFENSEMVDACKKVGLNDPIVVSSDYGTNVDLSRESKTIDHFIVSGTKNVFSLSANKVLIGLDKIASLLPVYKRKYK